ncbi:MAG: YbjN domain-containing protein [Aggregatilineales bacterium]
MLFAQRKSTDNSAPPPTNTLEHHAMVVESILKTLNVNPVDARLETQQGFGWNFRRGSAIIEIYVSEQGDRGFLQVLAPIIHLPTTNLLPLYRRLLELNLQLTNASLGVFYDVVYVFNERPLQGLDANETNDVITLVAGYADSLDNDLVNEFGGRLYSQVHSG